jgi:phosphoribosylglycinamide formyltransferase 1
MTWESEGSFRTHRLGILLSGRGSNFLAIAEGIAQGRVEHAEIAVVISNRSDAPGIAAARSAGFTTQVIEARGRQRAEHDAEIIASLQAHHVDLVCLAGYMRLLSAQFVRAFPQRILNIHPSLLRNARPSPMGLRSPGAPCTSLTKSWITASSCCRR